MVSSRPPLHLFRTIVICAPLYSFYIYMLWCCCIMKIYEIYSINEKRGTLNIKRMRGYKSKLL